MLKRLFGKGNKSIPDSAARGEDNVWVTHQARLNGIKDQTARLVAAGSCVIMVALTRHALEELVTALAAFNPVRCEDVFSRSALTEQIERGSCITVALASALPAELSPPSLPVDILVYGRHDLRAQDDFIVAFADRLGSVAQITFHLSFDDPLLVGQVSTLKPLLEKLGMSDDEAIVASMVTRSIESLQTKRAAQKFS